MSSSPQKIIIDTDPGVDDAMAIFYALAHPQVELLGLTTVFGNVSVGQASQNALTLLEMAGGQAIKVPVASGAGKPLERPLLDYPDFVHGKDGFGNQFLAPPQQATRSQTAVEFMVEQVMSRPGEVSLVAIGPLTNLAMALNLEPRIAEQVKQVVLMGGTLDFTGNVSPVAEANVFADPQAADQVMAAEWPVVMLGLDVTSQVLMSVQLFADIAKDNPRVGAFLQKAAAFYIDFYQSEQQIPGCYGHDLAAVAYVVQPDWFTTVSGSVCVATEGVALGQTIMKRRQRAAYFLSDWDERPQQRACMHVDAQALLTDFREKMIGGFWQ